MATTEELKARAKISDQIDQYGPDFLRNVLNDNPVSDITPKAVAPSYAQLVPGSMDSPANPLAKFIPMSQSGLPPVTPEQLQALSKKTPDQAPVEQKASQDTTNFIDDGSQPEDSGVDTIENPISNSINVDAIAAKNAGQANTNIGSVAVPAQPERAIASEEATKEDPKSTTEQFNAQLKEAVQKDADRQLLFGVLKAAQMGGKALSKTPGQADTSYADAELAQHNLFSNQLKTQMDIKEEFADIQQKQNKRDPASPISNFYQEAIKQLSPGFKADGMSAADLEKAFPQIEGIVSKKLQLAQMNAYHQQQIENTKAGLDIKQQNADTAESKANAMISSSTNKQDIQSFTKTSQMLEQMRGNPAVQQAEKDLYAAKKFNSLLSIHSDPNKLNPQMVQLAASEIGKIATGGVPTHSELQGLNRSTLPSKLAELSQTVLNEPSAANQGAFLKEYQSYINSLSKDAKGLVLDRYGRILESNKGHLSIKDYDTLKTNYLGRFDNQESASPSQNEQVQVVDKNTGVIKSFPADQANKIISAHPERFSRK